MKDVQARRLASAVVSYALETNCTVIRFPLQINNWDFSYLADMFTP